jgi:hypothetical protein
MFAIRSVPIISFGTVGCAKLSGQSILGGDQMTVLAGGLLLVVCAGHTQAAASATTMIFPIQVTLHHLQQEGYQSLLRRIIGRER